jgi:hypothetical protein
VSGFGPSVLRVLIHWQQWITRKTNSKQGPTRTASENDGWSRRSRNSLYVNIDGLCRLCILLGRCWSLVSLLIDSGSEFAVKFAALVDSVELEQEFEEKSVVASPATKDDHLVQFHERIQLGAADGDGVVVVRVISVSDVLTLTDYEKGAGWEASDETTQLRDGKLANIPHHFLLCPRSVVASASRSSSD